MAEKAGKAKKTKENNKKAGIIAGIIAAIVIIIAIAICVVLLINNNKKLSDSYFKSDDTKYVLTLEAKDLIDEGDGLKPSKAHIVYFYSGDKITGIKAYYLYDDTATAEKALAKYNSNNDGLYKEIVIDGNYVVITSNESDYENLSAADIKQQIDFMESLKKLPADNADTQTESTETVETTDPNTPPEPAPATSE